MRNKVPGARFRRIPLAFGKPRAMGHRAAT
jgi:hypothetical protein